jgi:hypothetical protein
MNATLQVTVSDSITGWPDWSPKNYRGALHYKLFISLHADDFGVAAREETNM